MPKLSGYVRFLEGYSMVGFAPNFGYPRKDLVWIESMPTGEVYMLTVVNGTLYLSQKADPPRRIRLEKGRPYPIYLEYSKGVASGSIAGYDFGTLPAPMVELPLATENIDYYPNGWDVPEYRTQAIVGAGIGAPIGGVAGYLLKEPLGPMVSEVVGAVLGGALGGGIGLLTGLGIIPVPQIPIPTFGAIPEAPGAPARLGKYQITG